jgi:autotransporter-associated beta strand protein
LDISGISATNASVKELEGSGNVTLGGQELQVAKGNFSGIISGTNGTLTKTGTGTDTLTLSGANTYFGATNINAGILELSGTIDNTSGINVLENATLNVQGVKTLNNLDSQGTVTFNNALTLAGDDDTTISGLNGTADVTKTGNGTTTLGDNNTVGTFVQQKGNVTLTGTLTGNYEQETTAGVFVADAGTGNTAIITGNAQFNGNVELESRLDVTGNLDLNSNSVVSIDLTQFDDVNTDAIINVDGNATIDGHATLNIEHWTPGTDSHTYHLFAATGNVIGSFDSHNVTFDDSTANNRQGFQIVTPNTIPNNLVHLTTFTKNLNVSRTAGGNWSSSDWNNSDTQKFYNGDYVTFNGSGTQESAVNADKNVETAGMKVEAGNWLFNGNKITGTVQTGNSADTLTTNDGKLTVTGNGTAATFNNALQFNGGIIVENNAELNLLGNEKVETATLTTNAGTQLNLQAVENKVTANGNVTLNGDVQFVYEGDPTQTGTIENVIKTTTGTIQGNFVTTDKLLSSTGAVVLNGNQLNVNYNASSVKSFADSLPNLSGNLVRIGQLIDVQNYADSSLLQQLYSLHSNEQDKFVQILFNQLGPELAADALQLSLWQPTTKIFNRLHEIGSLYENSFRGQCGTSLNYELWFEGFYRSENVSHDAFAGSYKSTRGGLLTGIESRLDQAIRGGFFFGYSNPRVANSIGRVEADDITFGAYSRIQFGYNTFLNTAIAYGSQDYQYRHNISRNSYSGDAMYASIELFRSVLWKNNLQLAPLLAVDFQKAWSDGFTTADTNQVIAKSSLDQTVLRIGLNSQWQPTYLLNFRTRLQYGLQIGGDLYGSVKTSYLATPDQNHTLTSVNLGKNRLNLGFGTDIYTSNNKRTRLFADYDLDLGERSTAHTGQFGFITNW